MGGRSSSREYGDRPSYVEEDPDRWNSARGSKFVPSAPPSQSSFGARRDFSNASDRSERDFGSGFERGSKFTPSASGTTTPSGLESRRSSYMAASGAPASPLAPSEADTASVWRRAAPLPSQPTSPNPAGGDASSPADSQAPATRKRLALAPRTQSSTATANSPPSSTSTKPNPFGNAAPVDTAEKEKAIEAKLEKLRLEAQEKANSNVRSSAFSSSTRSQQPLTEKKEVAAAGPGAERKAEPTRIMSNPIRREGLSFANAAGVKKNEEEEVKPAEPVQAVNAEEAVEAKQE